MSGVTKADSLTIDDKREIQGIEEETKAIMDFISNKLESQGMNFTNLVQVVIFINDMSLFARLNKVYGSYFQINPATRVTVALALVQDIANLERDSMHVQSISYWAPYSQAIKIADQVYVAGQIGLLPNSMELATSDYGISLRNLDAIASSQNCDVENAAMCTSHATVPVIFVTVPRLPRDAVVEWQVLYHRKDFRIPDDSDDDDEDTISSNFKTNISNGCWMIYLKDGSTITPDTVLQSIDAFLSRLRDAALEICRERPQLIHKCIGIRVFHQSSFSTLGLFNGKEMGGHAPSLSMAPVYDIDGGALFAAHLVFTDTVKED
ncbi:hypothetical protein BC829DRAFT_401579 [Chytridium lagenaria]|nr:hypothetical protein BC829DRAFT_401579 [Chytridium lagenaria]